MFRRRTGTGSLYADNQPRKEAASRWRAQHRSRLPRVTTADRLWGPGNTSEGPVGFDLGALVAKSAGMVRELMGVLADVGEEFTWCLRRRARLTPEFLADFSDVIGWYVVLHSVGLIDRRGVWIGPPLLPTAGLARTPESR